MTSSTGWSAKAGALLGAICLALAGCGADQERQGSDLPARDGRVPIAVFPIENLSGRPAPTDELRGLVVRSLEGRGFQALDEESLAAFMARHRVRYTGGVDQGIAQALQKESGVEGVLITSLELYSEENPPKISLTSRLVSVGENPGILWMDGVGLAGDDAPGLLALRLIEDPATLARKAVESLAISLQATQDRGAGKEDMKSTKKKFHPKVSYRSDTFDPEKKHTIAIVPFLNRSERRFAGDIVALNFARGLRRFDQFEIIEPGVVRRQLLALRVIMTEGITLSQSDAVLTLLSADLVLTGKVIDYQDYVGVLGTPKVDFSAQLIERKSRKVVWSSVSYNQGDDGVFFFDSGRVNTANAMVSQMIRAIGEAVLKE